MNTPPRSAFAIFVLSAVFFAIFASFLLAPIAEAHHVFGIEVSPAFELLHSFAELFFFACSGASLAWFLRNNSTNREQGNRFTSAPFATFFASTFFGALLAIASLLEGGGALFLLYDAFVFAFTLMFTLAFTPAFIPALFSSLRELLRKGR